MDDNYNKRRFMIIAEALKERIKDEQLKGSPYLTTSFSTLYGIDSTQFDNVDLNDYKIANTFKNFIDGFGITQLSHLLYLSPAIVSLHENEYDVTPEECKKLIEVILEDLGESFPQTHILKSDVKENDQLDAITRTLKERYQTNKAKNPSQIIKDNWDLDFKHLDALITKHTGLDRADYFREIGVLEPNKKEHPRTYNTRRIRENSYSKKNVESKLASETMLLKARYADKSAETVTQIVSENEDLTTVCSNTLIKSITGMTRIEYYRHVGVLKDPGLSNEREKQELYRRFEAYLQDLQIKYKDSPASSIQQICEENPAFSQSEINSILRRRYKKVPKSYFKKLGILE